MVNQYNWSTVVKKVRTGIRWVIVLVFLAILFINYSWLINLFNNI